jgi:hypothetical protein
VIESFYILLIVIFGGLTVLTLVTSALRANTIKDELDKFSWNLDHLEKRIHERRAELQTNEFDFNLCGEEIRALESQKACMLKLEEEYKDGELSKKFEEN